MTYEIYNPKSGTVYAQAISEGIALIIAQKLREDFRDTDFLTREIQP